MSIKFGAGKMDSGSSYVSFNEENEKTPILRAEDSDLEEKKTCYIYLLATFAAIGGFLFGYDTGVISGAMIPLKRHFNLSVELQEVVVSVTIGGAIIGSFTSAFFNGKFGRRVVLILASVVFTIGSALLAGATSVVVLILGRLTVGIAIGYASMTVPIYIAEAAPSKIRGQLVTVNQLMITLGQFAASVLNGSFSYIENNGWRYMLGFAGLPSLIMFIGFLFMPESPRWLAEKGKIEEAKMVLQKLRGVENVGAELNNIEEAISLSRREASSEGSLKRVLTTSTTRRALIVGCGLQAFQQLSGINTVMYYSASIIELAGVEDEKTIIWLAAAVAAGNFIFTLCSMALIEKLGRRKLLLISIFGVFLALCLLSGTFYILKQDSPKVTLKAPKNYTKNCAQYSHCFSCVDDNSCGFCYRYKDQVFDGACLNVNTKTKDDQSTYCNETMYTEKDHGILKWSDTICPTNYAWLPVVSMIFYLAMFAPGLGPLPWAVNSEIYPLWARNIGTSVATATNWVFNLIVALTFLNLMQLLTSHGAFLLYAGITLIGFVFFAVLLPETKGKKLEEIEELFRSPKNIH